MMYDHTSINFSFNSRFRSMDWKEEIKIKFGEHLLKLLDQYGQKHTVQPSLRKLATRSGLEYSNVQRISKGQVDLALTTIVALSKGLDMPARELLDF